jgi:hypothetical protein
VQLPHPGQRSRQPQLGVGIVAGGPIERRAQIVVLPLEALDPLGGARGPLVVGAVGEVRVVGEVTARRLLGLARARQPLRRVLRSGSRRRQRAVVRRALAHDQRLLDRRDR